MTCIFSGGLLRRWSARAMPVASSASGNRRLQRTTAALYRAVLVRMRFHQLTVEYVARRTADGRTTREIIRCLKRFLLPTSHDRLPRAPTRHPGRLNECLDI